MQVFWLVSLQILLQQTHPPQEQREEVHLQVQPGQPGNGPAPSGSSSSRPPGPSLNSSRSSEPSGQLLVSSSAPPALHSCTRPFCSCRRPVLLPPSCFLLRVELLRWTEVRTNTCLSVCPSVHIDQMLAHVHQFLACLCFLATGQPGPRLFLLQCCLPQPFRSAGALPLPLSLPLPLPSLSLSPLPLPLPLPSPLPLRLPLPLLSASACSGLSLLEREQPGFPPLAWAPPTGASRGVGAQADPPGSA